MSSPYFADPNTRKVPHFSMPWKTAVSMSPPAAMFTIMPPKAPDKILGAGNSALDAIFEQKMAAATNIAVESAKRKGRIAMAQLEIDEKFFIAKAVASVKEKVKEEDAVHNQHKWATGLTFEQRMKKLTAELDGTAALDEYMETENAAYAKKHWKSAAHKARGATFGHGLLRSAKRKTKDRALAMEKAMEKAAAAQRRQPTRAI